MRNQQSVRSLRLPSDSRLWSHHADGDFLDCFAVQSHATPRQAAEEITKFPGLSGHLTNLRQLVVTPFGLSNDGPEADDKIGPFPVEYEDDQELIAGFNDKHLDFRVCVISRGGNVHLATWVHRHNLGGRIYLASIMPFHIWVARDALSRVAKAFPPK